MHSDWMDSASMPRWTKVYAGSMYEMKRLAEKSWWKRIPTEVSRAIMVPDNP